MCDLLGRPIANRTWLGSNEPDVQAEPEEAQIPAKSNFNNRDSPSMPSKHILKLPGKRFTGSPLRRRAFNFRSAFNQAVTHTN